MITDVLTWIVAGIIIVIIEAVVLLALREARVKRHIPRSHTNA